MIPFNKPYLTGGEIDYIREAVDNGKLSGNGIFTQRCQEFLSQRYKFQKSLLTTSCTDALEMAALLLNIKEGDEVIIPSYTFVSTALAFVRQGALIRFVDSEEKHPNMNADKIEELINQKTKAIVVVHYAGMACEMDKILQLAERNNLTVIEDAAQAIESFYKGNPLGSLGDLSAFSFHETKNIISGEGGLLAINKEDYIHRSEIIWEKGTNRAEFFRGEADKYGWVDTGSSFLPSEMTAAFLWAQLEQLEEIQNKRLAIWNRYYKALQPLEKQGLLELPIIPPFATNNAHMFYVICENIDIRDQLIKFLRQREILAVFHYQSLHASAYYADKHDGRELPNCNRFTNCLLRLPLYYELSESQQERVIDSVLSFYSQNEK